MKSFYCGTGDRLQIGDEVCLHIEALDRGQVIFGVECLSHPKTVIEILSPLDEESDSASGTAF